MEVKASIIIVTFNQKKYVTSCIESILKQNFSHEVIVVDNHSNDGTVQLIKEKFPEIKIIETPMNRGYGSGNNLGVKHAKGEYIVILNPDTIVEKDWLKELVEPLESGSRLITTPKILLYDGSKINTCGNINHFTGLTFTRGLNEDPDEYNTQEYVSGFSGCCFAIRKKYFEELGGFDENFFIYNEDSDLSWRAHLKGYRILYIPKSIVRHDYKLSAPPKKIYHLEKNRYLILRKYLSMKDILFLFPSLLVAEALTWGYAIKNGWNGLGYKLKAIKDGLTTSVEKVRGDKSNLFKSLSVTIPIEQLTSNKAEKIVKIFANKVFEWNYKVIV
jgi:GT2 family glycosyltransferase